MKLNKIRWAITILSIIALIIHCIWPRLVLDTTSIFLVVIALIPWLAPVVKSVELPGGFKIEVQDIRHATNKIARAEDEQLTARLANTQSQARSPDIAASFATLRQLAEEDPNLALVGFRIEIERRLADIARRHDLVTHRKSASQLLRLLRERNILPVSTASGLSDIIALANQAAHGADVSPDAAHWVVDVAPTVLEKLDGLTTEG